MQEQHHREVLGRALCLRAVRARVHVEHAIPANLGDSTPRSPVLGADACKGVLLPAMGDPLSIAVILHRLPIGMAIWWTFRPAIGRTAAITAFAIIVAATAFSYFLADPVVNMLESRTLAYFQAFVSGSLIDLVVVGAIEKFRKRPQVQGR